MTDLTKCPICKSTLSKEYNNTPTRIEKKCLNTECTWGVYKDKDKQGYFKLQRDSNFKHEKWVMN